MPEFQSIHSVNEIVVTDSHSGNGIERSTSLAMACPISVRQPIRFRANGYPRFGSRPRFDAVELAKR